MWLIGGLVFLGAAYLQSSHLQPWFSWQSEVFAFVSLIFLAIDAMENKAIRHKAIQCVPKIIRWFFLVIAIIAMQWGLDLITFGGDALVRSLYFFVSVVAISVGFSWAQLRPSFSIQTWATTDPLRGLAICLVVSAILSVVLVFIQSTQVNTLFDAWVLPPLGIRRPGANLGQPNHLATLILLGLASLTFLYATRCLSSAPTIALLVLLLMGLAVTESRTALVSTLVMSVWWWSKRQRIKFPWGSASMLLLWLVLLFLVWVWPHAIARFHEGRSDIMSSVQGISTSGGSRLTIWPQLWSAVLEKPWFGWGLGEVVKAHNAVLDRYVSSEPFSYAHNIFLDMALGCGVGITSLAILGLAWWFVTRFRAVQTMRAWYCASLVLPFAVHSLFEFPFAYAYFLVPCMVAAGFLEAHTWRIRTYHVSRTFVICILVVFTALLLIVGFEYIRAEEDFRIARFEALRVGKTPRNYERPHLYLLTQLGAMLEATRMVPNAGMSTEQIAVLRQVSIRFPWLAIQNRYALSLALNGDPTEALRQLKVMRAMHGELTYASIRAQWRAYGFAQYPQLQALDLP